MLDLGAGSGLYSIADAIDRERSIHLLADLSFRHVQRGTKTGTALGLRVCGVTCSAEALPFASDSLDSVLLIEVLQFLDHDALAVREIARVIRPGGMLLCEQDCPPVGTPLVVINEPRLRKRRVGYTRDALRQLAEAEGLMLEDARPISGPVGRSWERLDGRIFGRSRTLHYLLFPIIKLLAWLSTPPANNQDSGTVLFLFRKTIRESISQTDHFTRQVSTPRVW
jgi:SAM-dependent methyltransferase